jgi:prepilin peptidase CpaA
MFALTVIAPLGLLCAGAVISDVRLQRVPNLFNLTFIVGGLCFSCARDGWAGAVSSLAGAALCASFLVLPFLMRMAGGGDVKFLAAAGAITGWRLAWPGFLAGAAAGGAIALAMMFRRPGSLAELKRSLILLEAGCPAPAADGSGGAGKMPYTVPLSIGFMTAAVVYHLAGAA